MHRISAAMLVQAGVSGCMFRDPMTMSVVRGGRSKPIGIVLDSPEVRDLVRKAEDRQRNEPWNYTTRQFEDRLMDPEKYSPGRKSFFEAMDRAPHIVVKENTRVHVVEFSKVKCDFLDPEATITYTRFTVLNGPSKGQQVWICRNINAEPFGSP
jgi:hypothetical protein